MQFSLSGALLKVIIVVAVFTGVPWRVSDAANPAQDFAQARAHFIQGRELQELHRNTKASRAEFEKALAGFKKVAAAAGPGTRLAARAQYMVGSTYLFLEQPEDALANYAKVLSEHRDNPEYWEKAIVRKAMVECDYLKPEAARATIEIYLKRFPKGLNAGQYKQVMKLQKALAIVGGPAPELKVRRWFNRELKRGSVFGKETVMLYFWATWCPNCLKEVGFITDLEKRYGSKGLQLVGITNHSRGQNDEKVEQYIGDHGFAFPVGVDDGGVTSRAYEAPSVPTAVLVDRRGVVRWHDHPAALSDSVIEQLLKD